MRARGLPLATSSPRIAPMYPPGDSAKRVQTVNATERGIITYEPSGPSGRDALGSDVEFSKLAAETHRLASDRLAPGTAGMDPQALGYVGLRAQNTQDSSGYGPEL